MSLDAPKESAPRRAPSPPVSSGFLLEVTGTGCRFTLAEWRWRRRALAELLCRERSFFDSLRRLSDKVGVSCDRLALCLMNSRVAWPDVKTFLLLSRKKETATPTKEGERVRDAAAPVSAEKSGVGDDVDGVEDPDGTRQPPAGALKRAGSAIRRAGVPDPIAWTRRRSVASSSLPSSLRPAQSAGFVEPAFSYFSSSSPSLFVPLLSCPSRWQSLSPSPCTASALYPKTEKDCAFLQKSVELGLALVPVDAWACDDDDDVVVVGARRVRGGPRVHFIEKASSASRVMRERLVVVRGDWAAVCLADEVGACDLPSPVALPERSTIDQRKTEGKVDDWSVQKRRSSRSSSRVPVPAIDASAVDCASAAAAAKAERSKVPESRPRRTPRRRTPPRDATQRREIKKGRTTTTTTTTTTTKTSVNDPTLTSVCSTLNNLTLDHATLADSSSDRGRTGAKKKN